MTKKDSTCYFVDTKALRLRRFLTMLFSTLFGLTGLMRERVDESVGVRSGNNESIQISNEK